MSEIPKHHKACVYDEPGKISTKIETLVTPEPGPGEVLINLYVPISSRYSPTIDKKSLLTLRSSTHSGICHSDLGVMENSVGRSYHSLLLASHLGSQYGRGLICFLVGLPTSSYSARPDRRSRRRWESGQAGPLQRDFHYQGRRPRRREVGIWDLW